ncbi:MAG TPA: aminoacyl-tRNA hydrolase [Bacteroidales bacterium]|nr:aminoacyl-tRNA hydrolase [Bacteroidales bacterium]HPT21541.1 aminoacyl-tRNA hydrolase [Bacteroidales bacterium]
MKYLIVGLGNIGEEYKDTRHNIGFTVLDAMAMASNISFIDMRYGAIGQLRYKGRDLILLKPSTYMNLSGNAVNYWLKKENIPVGNMLVIVDDIALPLGSIRMRSKGADGGHNGLAHISTILSTTEYPRIRVGTGNGFKKGSQIDFVLGKWTSEEKEILKERIPIVVEMIKSFAFSGVELTMTSFNKIGKMPSKEEKSEPGEKI